MCIKSVLVDQLIGQRPNILEKRKPLSFVSAETGSLTMVVIDVVPGVLISNDLLCEKGFTHIWSSFIKRVGIQVLKRMGNFHIWPMSQTLTCSATNFQRMSLNSKFVRSIWVVLTVPVEPFTILCRILKDCTTYFVVFSYLNSTLISSVKIHIC